MPLSLPPSLLHANAAQGGEDAPNWQQCRLSWYFHGDALLHQKVVGCVVQWPKRELKEPLWDEDALEADVLHWY